MTDKNNVQSESQLVERTNPPSTPQEASGVGSPNVISTDSTGVVLGAGSTNDVQMHHVVGSAASSSSQPNRDKPSGPLEASDPDPNLVAQNNLRSLMKKAFLDSKITKLKKSRFWYFCKGVSPWFWSKI